MHTPASRLMEQCGQHLTGPRLDELTAARLAGDLASCYDEPRKRYYHTLRHLYDVVGFLVEVADELRQPRPTFWAALGHDSIYLPENKDGMNERLSGALTSGLIMPYMPKAEVRRVDSHIRATADHAWDGKDTDLAYFLDADMKILGAPAEEFDEYDDNIRREYNMFEEAAYRRGRAGILRGFYNQPRLFITDVAHERFETQAKANLERKIGELLAA